MWPLLSKKNCIINSVLICLTRKAFLVKTQSIIILLEHYLITYTFLPDENGFVEPDSVVTFVRSGLSAMMKKQVSLIAVYRNGKVTM